MPDTSPCSEVLSMREAASTFKNSSRMIVRETRSDVVATDQGGLRASIGNLMFVFGAGSSLTKHTEAEGIVRADGATGKTHHEQEPGSTSAIPIPVDRRADQGARGLAGRDAGAGSALIKKADPEVVEEWKWRGVPVWSHGGIICTGETYKNVVKMTFAKGAALEEPFRPLQLESRRQHAARHRLPRRRGDRREGFEGTHSRGREAERVALNAGVRPRPAQGISRRRRSVEVQPRQAATVRRGKARHEDIVEALLHRRRIDLSRRSLL